MGRSPSSDGNSLKKGPWTPEEDKKLVDFINKNGHGSWRALPNLAGLNRCGKSCRLRWANYLRPDIKRGKFSEGEERTIIHLHSILGNKWSRIATHLPRRTDNEIKNFWNTHLKKKLLQMGIDPITHKPITDLNLLMNLSQLLLSSPTNFGNVKNMNPWDITALRTLQADATQLAKIHMLQSLIQVMNNTGSLPNVARESLLGSLNPSPFEGLLVNGINTLYSNTGLTTTPEVTRQEFSDHAAVPNSWASFEGGSNYSFSSSYEAQTADKPLPGLVSVSPECSNVEQIFTGEKIKPITCFFSEHSANSTIFEGWEQLVDDKDQASDSFWRDILNEASSPAICMAELPF